MGNPAEDLQVPHPHVARDLRPLRPVREQLLPVYGEQPRSQAGSVLQDPVHARRNASPQGAGRHEVHDRYDGSGMGEMYLLQPLRYVLPARHRHGRHVQLSARRAVFSGLRAVGTQDWCGYAPRIRRPDGRDHRRLGGHLRMDGRGKRGRVAGPRDPDRQGRLRCHVHPERPRTQALS